MLKILVYLLKLKAAALSFFSLQGTILALNYTYTAKGMVTGCRAA
jgi:hypothetical protein